MRVHQRRTAAEGHAPQPAPAPQPNDLSRRGEVTEILAAALLRRLLAAAATPAPAALAPAGPTS
jgi:hypothetical protein